MLQIPFKIAICVFILIQSVNGSAQSSSSFAPCEIFFKDGKSQKADIKERDFIVKGKLLFGKTANYPDTTAIDYIVIDSTSYFLRRIKSISFKPFVVVERIVEGKLSLFISARSSSSDNFYAEKLGEFHQLRVVKKYIKDQNFEIDEYKSVLSGLTSDCPDISNSSQKVSLNIKSLKSFFIAYNTKCGWLKQIEKTEPKKDSDLLRGFTVGYSRSNTNVDFGGTGSGAFYSSTPANINNMFLGYTVKRKFGKYNPLSLINDILYERVTGKAHDYGYELDYDIHQITDHVGIGISIFNSQRAQFSMDIGVQAYFSYQIINNSHHTPSPYAGSNVFKYQINKFIFTPEYYFLVQYKKIGIRYQYVNPNIYLTNIDRASSTANRFSVTYFLPTNRKIK